MTGAGACYAGILARVDAVILGARCRWCPKRFEKDFLADFGIQT